MLYKESPWFNLGWLSVGWKTQKNELFLDIREYYFVHENGTYISFPFDEKRIEPERFFLDISMI